MDPAGNRVLVNVEMLSQCNKRARDSSDCENRVSTHITSLLPRRLPLAIRRFVISVVILTAKAHACGHFAHIRNKVLKRLPARANGNPSTYVPMRTVTMGIRAATPHPLPGLVCSCFWFPGLRFWIGHSIGSFNVALSGQDGANRSGCVIMGVRA